ncbi:hypothetical protein GW17_00041690 [Ensete ventricosum]|nr:hypothetical protein GW17_00041690 [Ensete ventricosum]
MDIVEAIIGQRKRWDLDGRRRYNGYSIRSIGCSVSVALQKKMLATSKGKVRSLGGRCWEGKERLTGDQIWSRSCREVEHCTSATRALRSVTQAGVVDSILNGLYLLLEREICTDEERIAFRVEEAKGVREGGDE